MVPLVRRVRTTHRASHGTTHTRTHARRRIVVGTAHVVAAVAVVLLAEGRETLLLGGGVDVSADNEADDVEEGHPEVFGQELLGKCQRKGRDDPGHLHDLPEADLDGGANLVESTGASDKGHGDKVDAVLDGSNLEQVRGALTQRGAREHTTRLLTIICRILALRLVRPRNTFCSIQMRT